MLHYLVKTTLIRLLEVAIALNDDLRITCERKRRIKDRWPFGARPVDFDNTVWRQTAAIRPVVNMSDGSALKSDFLGSLVGSTVSQWMWDAKKHIKSAGSCWTRPSSSSAAGRPWKTLITCGCDGVEDVLHTAYYRSLMRRPMRLNLSSRCNKGRVVINRTGANYRSLVVRTQPSRGVVAVLDHRRGRTKDGTASPRSATGRGHRGRPETL